MKKLLVILLAVLTLTACASNKGYSQVSGSDDVIFEGPNSKYTKADLYKSVKVMSEDAIIDDILKKVAEIDGVDVATIDKETQEYLDEWIAYGYESYITYYYGSEEAFVESVRYSMILEELKKLYIEEKFDEYVEDDKPVKMQVAYFDDLDTAKQCLSDIEGGNTFDTAVINNGYTTDASEKVYLDSDDLPIQVKSYVNDTDKLGLSTIITTSTTTTDADGNEVQTGRYYLINIIDRDVNNFKDDYLTAAIANVENETIINHELNTHEIKFYDQDLYDVMSKAYEVLK